MKNNLYTISAHLPFADTLAQWCLGQWGHDPLLLSRALILLPSHRSASSLREAFLRISNGRPLLLPRMVTLGDADEDMLLISPLATKLPHSIPSPSFTYERLFLLARLVQRYRKTTGNDDRMDHALTLAASLAGMLDELEREEISLENISQIVPSAFAEHWQITVEFLQILSEHWPMIAREQELMSPGQYQATLLRELAAHWMDAPPDHPIIAAGTTGSIPATADMLSTIAALKQGFIVLPGLDTQADEAYFTALDESHPQWGIAQLITKLKATREDIGFIGEKPDERVHLMSEVMRPADISDAWRTLKPGKGNALQGLQSIECGSLQEEATVIALMLREVLEQPGKTAALVTHNRALARRVAAIMPRFGVTIDDSAGLPLKETPLLAFMRLCLEAATQQCAPLALLSMLKHPLAHAGMERIQCLEMARDLEVLELRGLRRGGGIETLRQSLLKRDHVPPPVYVLLDNIEQAFASLMMLLAQKEAPLLTCLDTHIACVEAMSSEDIWESEAGEAFTKFVYDLRGAQQAGALIIETQSYPAIFEELLYGKVLRPRYGMHPRLKILSPIEARMQSFDRVILGGLNEGSWPPAVESDPWFSRPMRQALGLPAPERRHGLAAHDFFMLACGKDVIFTRAGKEDGVPTQPSRWLIKLAMLAGGLPENPQWRSWAQRLDAPEMIVPIRQPAPTPPLAARPKTLSVTKIETWMRDPYAIYASEILRLRALEPLGRDADASDFGNAVHKALERFVKEVPGALPGNALAVLLRHGREAFAELFAATPMEILWWPRFDRIARWVIGQEDARRASLTAVMTEVKGQARFGDFLLHGRADRIEQRADGTLAIIDYKTGSLPANKDIDSGLANQLVLLALIAMQGDMGLRGVPQSLEYWQVQGGLEAGEIKSIAVDKLDKLMEEAKAGLLELIARFNNPDFPYRSVPIPARASRYTDYDHLARVKEWG